MTPTPQGSIMSTPRCRTPQSRAGTPPDTTRLPQPITDIIDVSKAWIGYLVGYDSTNIYRIWNPVLKKVIRTRDVIFNFRESRKVLSDSRCITTGSPIGRNVTISTTGGLDGLCQGLWLASVSIFSLGSIRILTISALGVDLRRHVF
jgi:hypothetical protein